MPQLANQSQARTQKVAVVAPFSPQRVEPGSCVGSRSFRWRRSLRAWLAIPRSTSLSGQWLEIFSDYSTDPWRLSVPSTTFVGLPSDPAHVTSLRLAGT